MKRTSQETGIARKLAEPLVNGYESNERGEKEENGAGGNWNGSFCNRSRRRLNIIPFVLRRAMDKHR